MRRAGRQSLFLLVPAIVLCGSANGQAETPATSQPTLDKWAQHYYDRVARFKAETVRPGGVVLVGSSHIEGLDAETWLPRWDVVNRGISSDRIGLTERGILHRLDCSVFDCQPGIIVIQNGANDLGELWRHGTPSIDEIATCYAEVVRRIRTKLPDVPLLISGLKPTRDRYAGLVPLLVELDGRLKQIAADQGCPFIEVYGDLAGDDGLLRPELSRDGLHLTPAGYALWARRLDGALTRASRAADGSLIASLVTREPDSDLRWFDARQLCSEGKAWDDTEKFYERLPARAEAEVTEPVWNLSKNTAGLAVRFITDSKRIGAIWDGGGAMNHMAATGNSGLDLYVRRADGWVFMGVGKPSRERTTTTLARGLSGEPAEYLLYLPLYHAVSEAADRHRGRRAAEARAPARDEPRPADRLLRHVDHAGRLRLAGRHVPRGHPRPVAGSRSHQPRLLGRGQDGAGHGDPARRTRPGGVCVGVPAEHDA